MRTIFLTLIVCIMLVAIDGFTKEAEIKKYVEPIVTEETMPNEVGDWDFRTTFQYTERNNDKRKQALLPKLQLFYGMTERLGGEFEFKWIRQKIGSGETYYDVGDLGVALKWLLLSEKNILPGLVLGFELGYPLGDNAAKRIEDGTFEWEVFLALIKDFKYFTIQGNFATQIIREFDATRRDSMLYNWALAVPFLKKFHFITEINGVTNTDNGTNKATFMPGLKYNFSEDLFVALGIPIGVHNKRQANDWGVISQIQIEMFGL